MSVIARGTVGWSRFVLVSPDAGGEPAALATAGSSMEAFLSLVPDLQAVVSAHGEVVLAADGARLSSRTFQGNADWLLVGLDRAGRRHALLPTRHVRPGTGAEAWQRMTEPARRIAERRWAELERVRALTG